jgi:hypothetical protein
MASPRLVQVIHRHGARAPLNNVLQNDEFRALLAGLAAPDLLDGLHPHRLPADADETSMHDVRDAPMGALTRLGVVQAVVRGRALLAAYAPLVREALERPAERVWVHSSLYRRTRLTARAVLLGLLGTNGAAARGDDGDDGAGAGEEAEALDADTGAAEAEDEGAGAGASAAAPRVVPIHSSGAERCPIAVYESRSLYRAYVGGWAHSAWLARLPERWAPFAADVWALANEPATGPSPPFVHWIRLADGLNFARRHGETDVLRQLSARLPLEPAAGPGAADARAARLAAVFRACWEITHTRYLAMHEAPQGLALGAGPMLRALLRNIDASLARDKDPRLARAPSMAETGAGAHVLGADLRLAVFSGHDVTLSPLLVALAPHGGVCVTRPDSLPWPDFASALAVELVADAHGTWHVAWRFFNAPLVTGAEPFAVAPSERDAPQLASAAAAWRALAPAVCAPAADAAALERALSDAAPALDALAPTAAADSPGDAWPWAGRLTLDDFRARVHAVSEGRFAIDGWAEPPEVIEAMRAAPASGAASGVGW